MAHDQVPVKVALNCQRPVLLFGRSYRWIYQTADSSLSLRGPLDYTSAVINEYGPSCAKTFIANGPQ